ncbi:MAG: hypothetical protein L0G94_11420 [Brachybacterium sp.]|uniref:hypothetical protein n=1 Tax=Brachybacterium sp. TaxID=1891286 RepID=UPI002648B8DB|nr:hypothetical protein [Brachybacterium sp.]MDN5687265.1 hypothetical protein [Brachybacterium sp.]
MPALPSTLPRAVLALSAVALVSGGLTLSAGSASAALTTYCSGDAADVTVPGDLVVAEGGSCVLDGVTVEGTTQVRSGADLLVENSAFGDVDVAPNGYFDATSSAVDGNLTSTTGYGVYLDDSSVGGAYQGEGGTDAEPFLYSFDTSFAGTVDVTGGPVHLQAAEIAGDVTTRGTPYTDILDSTLAGDLQVTGSPEGTAICESEVDGDAAFRENEEVQIGHGLDLMTCSGTNYFGADVLIEDSTGAVDVTGNIVRGDLGGEGNDPAPTGGDNRVRGSSDGQFTDLAPASQTLSARSAPADHSGELVDRRDDRRASAEAAAELAGPAQLG